MVEEVATVLGAVKASLQLYDVAQIAHHFGTSRLATLYRLRNLRLITAAQLEELEVQEERHGRDVARLLALRPDDRRERNDLRYRFFGLAIEVFRREEITRDKLFGLAQLVGIERLTHPDLGSFELEVGFSATDIQRNLLGRDFFNLVQIGFREHHLTFYMTPTP